MTGVNCTFDSCTPSIVSRVVVAAIDQLSAAEDVDIVVLDAIGHPVAVSVEALHGHGIEHVAVALVGGVLEITFGLTQVVADTASVLGEGNELVSAFFDVATSTDPARVRLTGSME